jgi:SAM-dependent methyltransferase
VRRGVDHELRVGSTAHYEDATYYADTYRDRVEDIAYYVKRAVEHGGPVLEYGCGEGRITLPIAERGIAITGVDHSEAMLAALKAKRPPKNVQLRRGDMRTVRLRKKFPLVICAFNTFLHLYTRQDVEQFLARVKEHLTPRGTFLFDVSMPMPSDLSRDASRAYKSPAVKVNGARHAYAERFDYDPIRQVLFVSMEFTAKNGDSFVTPLAHRQFFPAELEALLHYNGFAIATLEGGFRGEPVDRHTDSLVYTCEKR